MSEATDGGEILARFEAAFSREERNELAARLLNDLLIEAACPSCGKSAFVLPPDAPSGSFECPSCRRRTWVRRDAGGLAIMSEERLQKVVERIRSREWRCPEHAETTVRVTAVQFDERNAFSVHISFVCCRRRGLFRRRIHTGAFPVDLLAFEADLPAGGE